MKIKIKKTDTDYKNALARLEIIFDAKKDSKNGDELNELATLIELYENENYPLDVLNLSNKKNEHTQ
jgi:HTH-type transcriptional regulator / antitoxin HigA